MTAPNSFQLALAISVRGRVARWVSTAAQTLSAKSSSSVIRIDCAAVSCSAWL
jgi:hypothetical protein